MKSNLKTYRITSIILMICCAGMLINSRYQKGRTADIIDQYFDLQMEYDKLFDGIQELEVYSHRLEEQVDRLILNMSPADLIELDSIDPAAE